MNNYPEIKKYKERYLKNSKAWMKCELIMDCSNLKKYRDVKKIIVELESNGLKKVTKYKLLKEDFDFDKENAKNKINSLKKKINKYEEKLKKYLPIGEPFLRIEDQDQEYITLEEMVRPILINRQNEKSASRLLVNKLCFYSHDFSEKSVEKIKKSIRKPKPKDK